MLKHSFLYLFLPRNADCVVRIDHDEFHCHLLVLQSYSTFFDEKNCNDIDLSDVRFYLNCA